MDWAYWLDKNVFLKLKTGGYYNGLVIEVDDSEPPLVWITLIDRYQERVTVVHSEIIKIKEESGRKK